jgi:tetratricopeptide (TPR) repeat protein
MKFLLKFIFFAVILSHESFAMAEKKNIQEEFSQGIALIKSKDYNQAKLIFTHLIKEYPEIPETYNNLALINVAQGDFIKAQETLKEAFKHHPSYNLIYENLNTIYAEIAQSIYNKSINGKASYPIDLKRILIIDHISNTTENNSIINTDEGSENKSGIELYFTNKPVALNKIFSPNTNEIINTILFDLGWITPFIWCLIILIIITFLFNLGWVIKSTLVFSTNLITKVFKHQKALKPVHFSRFFIIE